MTDSPNLPADADAGDQLVLTSPEDASSLKDFILWAGVIVLAVLCVFSPAMHGRFLWDDDHYVEANRDLHDATGLGDIWTGHWRLLLASPEQRKQIRDVYTPQYYPFTHTTYWIEAQIFGSPEGLNPTVFHVTNMLLHAAGAILLWFVLRELAVPGAWVIAVIFAVHPIQAESVAWISERKNVLAGALFFGSILAYLKSPLGLNRENKAVGKDRDLTLYFVSLTLFALAVLSKTVACSMPAVVLVLLWWKRGRLTWEDVAWTGPFFVFGLAMSMFTSWIEVNHIGAAGPDWHLSMVQRILLAGNAVWFYAGKLIFPWKLTFIYPKWNLDPARAALWIGPAMVIVVLAVLFSARKRIGRGPLAAVLLFIGVLVPALGFFNVYPMRYSYVADHFQYLAGPALIALIVAIAAKLLRKLPKAAPYVVSGIVLIVLMILAALQSTIYAGPLELWVNTVKKNPNSAMVQYNTGVARFRSIADIPSDEPSEVQSRLNEAKDNFEAAVRLDPGHDRAWEMWGETLMAQNKPELALAKFDRALALDAEHQQTVEGKSLSRDAAIDAAIGRGRALLDLKRPDDAMAAYKAALAILESQRPYASRVKASTVFASMGKILAEKGDRKGALADFGQAVTIEPKLAVPHYEYGSFLVELDKKPEAAEQFAAAAKVNPNYVDPLISLGLLQLSVDNYRGAQLALKDATNRLRARGVAIESNPEFPRLQQAIHTFATQLAKSEAAATKPSTTRATTQATTDRALRALMRTSNAASEVYTRPATQPSSTRPSS